MSFVLGGKTILVANQSSDVFFANPLRKGVAVERLLQVLAWAVEVKLGDCG